MQAQVEEMVIRGQKGFSGFITADTKFVFRSRYETCYYQVLVAAGFLRHINIFM